MATSGQTAVTTAGTAVRLATNQPCVWAYVKALNANTGLVFLGNDGAEDVSSSTGFQLAAGEVIYVDWNEGLGNLNTFWLDSAVSGEGVCWICS